MEVESLRSAADVLADFVHAPARHWEECLHSARVLIRSVIKRDIY
jgi:hypothetical protein